MANTSQRYAPPDISAHLCISTMHPVDLHISASTTLLTPRWTAARDTVVTVVNGEPVFYESALGISEKGNVGNSSASGQGWHVGVHTCQDDEPPSHIYAP
ncbi:hypothetical protein Hypma_007037, partial [Hypsizygus marmoreus]